MAARIETGVAIVGGGAAGMAAALEARAHGVDVLLLDEQMEPGGQVFRAIARRPAKTDEDRAGQKLVADFLASGAVHRPGAQVWQVERDGDGAAWRLFVTGPDGPALIRAKALVVATGAMERPVPIPGWTLPGVMTVGAAQTLLKTGGRLPEGPVWIAGQGPLPLLYAEQARAAGGTIAGILDTQQKGALSRALPRLPEALWQFGLLWRGAKLLAARAGSGVPVTRHVTDVEAVGTERLTAVRFTSGGVTTERPAGTLLLHEGVIPHTHMAMALGVPHEWDDDALAWLPKPDEVPAGLGLAGDCGGIGGALAAPSSGRLAALKAMDEAKLADSHDLHARIGALRTEHALAMRVRPFLDALYRPRPALLSPADDVIVCRCEEKTAGDIRAAVASGALGPNQVKSLTRCGMGPCQGRSCLTTLTTVIAEARGVAPAEVGHLRIRPPLKPVTLGELAGLAE